MQTPHHIYGIDFSEAQDAGRKIWIPEGVVKTDSLLIEACKNGFEVKWGRENWPLPLDI